METEIPTTSTLIQSYKKIPQRPIHPTFSEKRPHDIYSTVFIYNHFKECSTNTYIHVQIN